MTSLTVAVPHEQLAEDVRARLDPSLDIDVVLWDGADAPPRERIDLVVPPYMRQGRMLARLGEIAPRLVQGQAIGFEGVEDRLPAGIVYANASSVHETATAELTLTLILAAQRRLDVVIRNQERATWDSIGTPGLADRRVVLLGYGGVGRAIARRLEGFEAELVPVASRARDEDGLRVRGIADLPALLPTADVLVNALPGGAGTRRLIDDAALSALPDGALLVNIGRGPTVDTDALVDHVRRGRIRVASDVFDPEPLPADHPLWSLDGAIVSPHMGGRSDAMRPRIARLVAEQAERLARGEEPVNVVIRT
ncbi:NAD(P)-dependent oxidoreductase [Microbacterium betulae]|uniref:NAD(P)-dependent oxidoreductase n=1 Tax=Microbacterium betulae TaxID=2981139 RepID=A0AA97FIN2_9MICO|nr:NAD(P)-dependent oxidoreductase [Microbacterium sp. AB]WOF22734.1 NAD(P)-dependent oxidoreductase [Microbacterium sp. AB]